MAMKKQILHEITTVSTQKLLQNGQDVYAIADQDLNILYITPYIDCAEFVSDCLLYCIQKKIFKYEKQ